MLQYRKNFSYVLTLSMAYLDFPVNVKILLTFEAWNSTGTFPNYATTRFINSTSMVIQIPNL